MKRMARNTSGSFFDRSRESALLLGASTLLAASAAGCSCDDGTMVPGDGGDTGLVDAARRDVGAGLDGDLDSGAGDGDGSTDSGRTGVDSGRIRPDVSFSDGQVPPSLLCEYVRQDGVNYFLLAEDSEVSSPEWIESADDGVQIAVVWSDTDPAGSARSLYVFHLNGVDTPGTPAALAGTANATRPNIEFGGGRFWITYLQGGHVFAARLASDFTIDGTPADLGAAATTSAPAIAATSAGAVAAWAVGNSVYTAFITSAGALSGAARTVATESAPITRVALQSTGAGGVTLVFASGASPKSIGINPSTGEARGTSTAVSDATYPALAALDLAGQTTDTLEMPLAGASVFDVELTTTPTVYRDIAFRVITDDSSPNFLEQRLGPNGVSSWGASIDAFDNGFIIAHQEVADPFPRISLAFIDRDGCALSQGVSGRWPLVTTDVVEGASTPLSLSSAGELVAVSWTERSDLYVRYFTTFATCYQP